MSDEREDEVDDDLIDAEDDDNFSENANDEVLVEPGPKWPRLIRNWIIGAAVVVSVANILTRILIPAPLVESPEAGAREIDESADFSEDRALGVFRRLFPEAFAALRDETARSAAGEMNYRELDRMMDRGVKAFVRSQADHIASAPDNRLADVAARAATLTATFREEDTEQCADYMARPDRVANWSARSDYDMEALLMATLEAAKAGQVHPNPHPRTLSADDSRALLAGMAKLGISQETLDELADFPRFPVKRRCDVIVAYYGSAARMPAPQAARVTAGLLGLTSPLPPSP